MASTTASSHTGLPPTAIYRPLNIEDNEFRLLELFPSDNFDANLSGRLIHTGLASNPQYEALSYFWGRPIFSRSMQLDSRPFPITENLEIALRHIRKASEPRFLWIDVVCINQTDVEERNQQIRLMKDIYSLGQADLLWLGPYIDKGYGSDRDKISQEKIQEIMNQSVERTRRGMELMKNLLSHDIRTIEKSEENASKWLDGGRYERSPPSETFRLLDNEEQRWLYELLRTSPVWTRVWIMQEVSCAPRVILVSGQHSLDWEVIASFLKDTSISDAYHGTFSHGMVGRIVEHFFSTVQDIEHQRRVVEQMKAGHISTLMDVLARFQKTDATDPRDKIYGLLGLVSEPLSIIPDYGKTVPAVFSEVTSMLINKHANLDVICQSVWLGTGKRTSRIPSLPSWVPDFTFHGHQVPLFAQRSIYSAGSSSCTVPCRVSDTGALTVHGVVIGRVGPIFQNLPVPQDTERSYIRTVRDKLQHLGRNEMIRDITRLYFGETLAEKSLEYVNGESRVEAFWRTLNLDCKGYPIERLTADEITTHVNDFGASLGHNNASTDLQGFSTRKLMFHYSIYQWNFVIAENGLFLMVQASVNEGDVVAVLDGAKVPVILEPVDNESDASDPKQYKFRSVAYVHGFMDGEAEKWVDDGRLSYEEFLLV